MSSDSPDEAARKAQERAAEALRQAALAAEERARRMAAFSAKTLDEEDAPVAVRSFNEAREGADAGKVYSPKTGRVEEGTMSALPRKSGRGPSAIDDDELLAEIDAAVDAAESSSSPPLPDLGDDDLLDDIDAAVAEAKAAPPRPPVPPGLDARRLAAMADAAGDRGEVHAPAPEGLSGTPRLPKGLASLSGDAPVFMAERRPKGPTHLSDDDLSGLRPVDGVKPSSAHVETGSTGDGEEDGVQVVSGRGRGGSRPTEQDDDELLAEIDAAVEAAERSGGGSGDLKSVQSSWEDVAGEGRKKEPATKYSGPAIHSPGDVDDVQAKLDKRTPAPGRAVTGGEAEPTVKSDKPRAAGSPLAFDPGTFTAKLDREHREAPKIRSPADVGTFDVKVDREAREAPKLRNPTESVSFEVAKDKSSDELAKSAIESSPTPPPATTFGKTAHHQPPRIRSPGDESVQARRDAEPKPLPKMHSLGDQKADVRRDAEAKPLPKMHSAGDEAVHARRDAQSKEPPKLRNPAEGAADVRHDREHRETPKIKGIDAGHVDTRQDREHRAAPKIHSPADTMRPEVRQDREHREAPKIRSPADAEKFAVSLDRAARDTPMPRMANPTDAAFETRRDAEAKPLPKLRSPADVEAFEARQDARSKTPPALRNPTEAEAFEARRDAQAKPLPKMQSAADAETYGVRRDAQSHKPGALRNATDESFQTRQDAQRKALPHLRNPTEAEAFEARRDAQAKPLPKMRSPADAETFEAKQDTQHKPLPRMQSAADVEAYEAKFAWRQKRVTGIRNAADTEAEAKLDRETREKVDVFNPGQTEFDVKYEHESVWTTKPKRDVDNSSSKKKES
jgi:hypothetical protein